MVQTTIRQTHSRIPGLALDTLLSAVGYFLLAAATIHLTTDGRSHATVWPADALVLALLLKAPRGHWKWILLAGWLGNLVANGLTRGWIIGLLPYGAINMAQSWIAAVLLERARAGRDLLGDARSVTWFLVIAGILAPACGALAGSLMSMANYGQPFFTSFVLWFASNALGLMVCTPFLKAVLDGSYVRCFRERTPTQRLETFSLILGHAVLAGFVFGQNALPLLFLPMSSLLVLAFRLGRWGTLAGVMIVAVAGAIAAYCNAGPMALIHRGPVFAAIFFQIYLAVILCTALPVAAVVAARGEALNRLAQRERALRQIMSHSPDAILGFDESGTCHWADGRIEEHLALTREQLLGARLTDITSQIGSSFSQFVEAGLVEGDMQVAPDQRATLDFSPVCSADKTLEATLGAVTQDGHQAGVVVMLRDVSARRSREAAIFRLAETDDLTGVFNRKGFRARLSRAVDEHREPLSLALIDVDHFKAINDSYGHAVGDRVLRRLADMLGAGVRRTDLIGRLGGDEFAILFHCDLETARQACQRIGEMLAARPLIEEEDLMVAVSISCGIAQYRAGMTRGALFDQADTALYEVKRAGRNNVRASA
ncbi:MAG TPA: diguanylate cyclase [Novosphingobium sp.]|nr:diguanylate cyclase [Novosphingobium sp.]